jgi:leucyl-tRNA synthetase
MAYLNECYKQKEIPVKYRQYFLILINPLAPHFSEEIWDLEERGSIHNSN